MNVPLPWPHQVPFLNFVLEGGVRYSVIAACTMHAHFTPLNRAHSLHQAIPVVVPILSAFRSGSFATGSWFRFVRFLSLRFRLRLGLLRRRLRRSVSASFERTWIRHYRLLRLYHSGRLTSGHSGCRDRLTLLEFDADAFRDHVAEIHGYRFPHQRVGWATGAGERWTRSFQETRTRGCCRSRESLRECGRRWLAVLARTSRRARGLVGRNLEDRSALSTVARLFLDVWVEVVVRHRTTLLLLLRLRLCLGLRVRRVRLMVMELLMRWLRLVPVYAFV